MPQGKEGKSAQRNTLPEDEDMREAYEALDAWEQPALPEDTLICECYSVSVLDTKRTCGETRTVDMDLLRQTFKMGTG